MNYNYLFLISGFLWAIEMIPQLRHTYKTKETGDIQIWFPIICATSFIIFLTACIGLKNWLLFASHIPPFLCNVTWLGMIIKYRRIRK